MQQYTIAAFYKFNYVEDCAALQNALKALLIREAIFGTILVASEGINGTVAAKPDSIIKLVQFLRSESGFADLEFKYSSADFVPFKKQKVVIKPEIVTLKMPNIFPPDCTGEYVDPITWNKLLLDPDVVVIDTRNDFEVQKGTFQNAINPNTVKFSDFPEYVSKNLSPAKTKKVAMFCTGGIRCEKAAAYMLKQGFEQVYQLHGGILKYLETTEQENSLWQGDCFIFDDRIVLKKQDINSEFKVAELAAATSA